jgi:hypothetical protein
MSVAIIEGFEMAQVQEEQGAGVRVALGSSKLPGQHRSQRAGIGQFRQQIGGCQRGQARIRPLDQQGIVSALTQGQNLPQQNQAYYQRDAPVGPLFDDA